MGHKEDLARQCNKMEDDANHWRNKVSVKITKLSDRFGLDELTISSIVRSTRSTVSSR